MILKYLKKTVTENFKEGYLWEDHSKDVKASGGTPHFCYTQEDGRDVEGARGN